MLCVFSVYLFAKLFEHPSYNNILMTKWSHRCSLYIVLISLNHLNVAVVGHMNILIISFLIVPDFINREYIFYIIWTNTIRLVLYCYYLVMKIFQTKIKKSSFLFKLIFIKKNWF